ncbi:alpha-(1,3)-fucosyltransferase C-like [Anastrepha ludens]|uniref:alpha-(1,3)-fucosyltransferase C-like n=1 Tax=Anastrepha ludens TaxID=28586 RepID=UPI0023B08EA6|nr:alpha-(1,3)-fucosyltransferase C-like [Anastrepha ludens]
MYKYSIVTMSDADSESEFLDNSKKPKLRKIKRKRMSKSKRKNNFQVTHRRKSYIWIGVLLLVAVIVIIYFASIYNTHQTRRPYTPSKRQKKSILILNWRDEKVPRPWSRNCTIDIVNTNKPSRALKRHKNYEAVIMNSTAENVLFGSELIPYHMNSQLLIFATQKPLQFENRTSLEHSNFGVYNKSMSYSLKSDFIWHSYKIVRKNDSKIVAPALKTQWDGPQEKFRKEHMMEFFLGEVKESSHLALTVLNRPCQPARNELVRRIQENIDVHTYGECGVYNCSGETSCRFLPNRRANRTYKFYLAFEEELCMDYVGENFYKALGGRIVPVVFGGANYERFAPPQSYINARDFASIRDLTEYLVYLDQHPEEHVKYFTWHEKYIIQESPFDVEEICDFLQTADSQNTFNSSLEGPGRILSWLNENKCEPYELPPAWLS